VVAVHAADCMRPYGRRVLVKIRVAPADNRRMAQRVDSAGRTRWVEWWNLRCSDLLIPLAAAIVAVDALAVWKGMILRPLGGPGFTPVLPAAVLFAFLVGWSRLGLNERHLAAWWEFGAVMGVLLAVIGIEFVARVGALGELGSFLVGATEEELVFRLAAPLAVGGIVAWCLRRAPGDLEGWGTGPRVAAVVTAAVTFACMPGHLAQVTGNAWRLVPFVAIAMLWSYVVLRTGDLWPGLLVHALLNIATVCYLDGAISRPLWSLIVIVALGSYAWGAERAGRRLGLVRTVAIA